MRRPTEGQYGQLLTLGSGNMIISGGSRALRAMVKRGWLIATPPDSDNGFRITPDGLRALAQGVEDYGLPEFRPRSTIRKRVCANCGDGRYRYEEEEVDVPA